MTNKPIVSVIISFFNGEKFFEPAIQSVFDQTYKHWELLLVDDGSRDKSTEIARQYAEKYPEKVRYLEHKNHQNCGLSATRNLGLKHALGEYIAFLDADDIWLTPKLEKQVAILDACPDAGMVYGPTLMWYSWTGKPEDAGRDRLRVLGVQPNTLVVPPKLLTVFLRGQGETPATCGVLIRREVIEMVGGFEESFRNMFEDQAFFAKVCLTTSIFVEGECWDRYRQHPDSICNVSKKTGKYHTQRLNPTQLKYLQWLESYLSKSGWKNTEVYKTLQAKLQPYHSPIYLLYQGKALFKQIAWQLENN
ncbi:MAG: glycosyltransferase family A protein [Nostocaceae cyanobacterium]|nr:glycosyltransferase family A protein [Nostocaceae cyanobacterium]